LIPGGFVVTTSELLERMRDPVVMFSDGKRARVEWTNFDTYSNVAILKVGDVASTAGLRWGDSERVAAGNFAVTMGTMGGFTHSASIGFIAGTGRTGQSGNILYENLIQFQGMIGGGSGGPLMNLRGEVVGMIAAVPSRNAQMRITGQSVPNSETPASIFFFDNVTSNVAFAIPANELKPIVARLTRRENLNAQPGWLGVHLSRPDENEGEPQPPKLLGIFVGGPADRAGAMLDDLVLAVDGHPVQTAEELRAFLKQCRAGQKMTLKVRRGAQVHTLNVLIDARPDEKVIQRIPVRRRSPQSGYLPLEMRPVSPFLLMT
jgi:S1-C subfamily serine protease